MTVALTTGVPRLLVVLVLIFACQRSNEPTAEHPWLVNLTTDLDPALVKPAVAGLRLSSGLDVNVTFGPSADPSTDVLWLREARSTRALVDEAKLRVHSPASAAAIRDGSGTWFGAAGPGLVLVVNTARIGREAPGSLDDLSNPRLRGRIGVPELGSESMRALRVALTQIYGSERTESVFRHLLRNEPIFGQTDADISALLSGGRVVLALLGSVAAHSIAASKPGLQVVVPDQDLDGALLWPTFVMLPMSTRPPEPAQRLADALLSLPLPGYLRPGLDARPMALDHLRFATTQPDKETVP